jgi:hypothetical protein
MDIGNQMRVITIEPAATDVHGVDVDVDEHVENPAAGVSADDAAQKAGDGQAALSR